MSTTSTTSTPVALLLLVLLCQAAAVETQPVEVLRVIDGDTIDVALAGVDTRIRLLCIDTAESKSNAHGEAMPEGVAAKKALKELLPERTLVRLWGPGDTLETDRYKRTLAVILLKEQGNESAQEHMVQNGWSVYWQKYGRLTNPDLDRRLTAAQEAAKLAHAGAWATIPKWMTDKANERTAPRR